MQKPVAVLNIFCPKIDDDDDDDDDRNDDDDDAIF